MKKILLTGGTGFIGSRLYQKYRHKYDILTVSSKSMDVTKREAVNNVISSFNPDFVIHCAAAAVTDYCNQYPERCRAVNVDGTVYIAEACAGTGSRLVFLSTEQVFNGNTEPGPYCEEDIPRPDTVYGKNKLEAEKKIAEICDSLILRLTWMFGIPGRFQPAEGNILWNTIRQIMNGSPFSVPVNEYRGLTFIDELIDNFPKLLELDSGLYHTGSENRLNRYEAVCHIFRELGQENRIDELVRPDRQKYGSRPRDVRLNTTELRGCGIAFSDTPDAISRCVEEYCLKPKS